MTLWKLVMLFRILISTPIKLCGWPVLGWSSCLQGHLAWFWQSPCLELLLQTCEFRHSLLQQLFSTTGLQDYICSVWVVSQGFLIKSCKNLRYLSILDDTEVWGCLVASFYQRFCSSLASVDCAAYPFQNCFVVKADLYFRVQISVLFLYPNPTNTFRHQC